MRYKLPELNAYMSGRDCLIAFAQLIIFWLVVFGLVVLLGYVS